MTTPTTSTPMVPPVLVFGPEDLLVAGTASDALQHMKRHVEKDVPKPSPADYEFFDFDGKPLIPTSDGLDLEVVEAADYLRSRVTRLIAKAWKDVTNSPDQPTVPAEHRATVTGFLDGTIDFATLCARLVAGSESLVGNDGFGRHHTRGFGHILCHRVHLCG